MPDLSPMNVVVFSHLRWDFVFQRPQQLMTRCARNNNVLYCEEPVYDTDVARWDISSRGSGLQIAVPHLPPGGGLTAAAEMTADLLAGCRIKRAVFWYYTPIAFSPIPGFEIDAVVYDCMDELSAFRGAPPGLRAAEVELLRRCDLVFTGGRSLFEAKRCLHPSVHCFPSSIDRDFFGSARNRLTDPNDQLDIPHPRLGYCGVIDERMDANLLAGIADSRPDWHLVMLGPVVKISADDLPRRHNIHYLGGKPYAQLPSYLGNWDVALLPFAQNESTRFISPTKTPEYLAAGLPVVSTPVVDVVRPYGDQGLVRIADGPSAFVSEIRAALTSPPTTSQLSRIDHFLSLNSWDSTWEMMEEMVRGVAHTRYSPIMSASLVECLTRKS